MAHAAKYKRSDDIDVILQHNADGTIIPLRVRITEDGERHVYSIKRYRECDDLEARTMPDGVFVCARYVVYECHIEVFGEERFIRLYLNKSDSTWTMTWQVSK